MRFLLALSFFIPPGTAQQLTIGIQGVLRMNGDAPVYGVSNSRRYLVGPMIEVGLPFHFALEADALYSRLGNTFNFRLIGDGEDIRTIANSWQFPLMVKYRVPLSRVKPFASIGIVPRYASGTINSIHYGFLPGDITFASSAWSGHDHALALGGGLGIGHGRIRITPEVRYLRWRVPANPSLDDAARYLQPPGKGEVQVLLGIGWSKL